MVHDPFHLDPSVTSCPALCLDRYIQTHRCPWSLLSPKFSKLLFGCYAHHMAIWYCRLDQNGILDAPLPFPHGWKTPGKNRNFLPFHLTWYPPFCPNGSVKTSSSLRNALTLILEIVWFSHLLHSSLSPRQLFISWASFSQEQCYGFWFRGP